MPDGSKVRPEFVDVSEMNEIMIARWNERVSDEDHVWHLGDVYFGSSEGADAILSRLKGKKRLIMGNHDKSKDPVLDKHFQKIVVEREFKEEKLLLMHSPTHVSRFDFKPDGWVNVHGHIHRHNSPEGPYINVSVEKTNYAPVLLEDVRKLLTR